MSAAENSGIEGLAGQFEGKGKWRDSGGKSADYEAFLTIQLTDEHLEVRQKHVHSGGASEGTYWLNRVAPFVYRVEGQGNDGGGYGFVMNDVLRFFFDNPLGSITEIGFHATAPGVLAAYGFTNRNSSGNYIMWHEELQRAADAE